MPTYCTKLPDHLVPFLDATAALYSKIEHEMHVLVLEGSKTLAQIEKYLQGTHGVDSTTIRNVWDNLKGKHQSIAELQDVRRKELKGAISSIEKSIKKLRKQIKSKKKAGEDFSKERFTIHQKQRRLAIKKTKLAALGGAISLCFGSKKLFNAQHHLEENGYESHADWKQDWQATRSSGFMMVGNKIYGSGNQLCRLTAEGTLKITVPIPLLKEFGGSVAAQGIKFRYGQGWIDAALVPTRRVSSGKKASSRIGTERALTHRFVRKAGGWYIHTTVELPEIALISSRKNGAIGIDLNVKSIAWAHCDNQGNLSHHGQIAIDLKGKTSEQSEDILSKAMNEIITVAAALECPIVIETLDFSAKKTGLREEGKRYAEMLSQFCYAKFGELVKSKAYRAGLQVIEVNPAYSSLMGLTKFMSMYGRNSGTAAGLVLARRCFRFSERLPLPVMALVSPVDGTRHLWSSWRRAAKALVGCTRHSYFAMKARVEVKPIVQPLAIEGKTIGKPQGTSVILSEPSALCSRTVGIHGFTQLCLGFQ